MNTFEKLSLYGKTKRKKPRHLHRKLSPKRVFKMGYRVTSDRVKGYRGALVRNKTRAEVRLKEYLGWIGLKHKYKFQAVMFGYIIDFYFPDYLVGFEVDGSSHDNRREYDEQRTKHLNEHGIRIVRFTNEEVFENKDRVISTVQKILRVQKKIIRHHRRNKESFANRGLVYTSEFCSQEQLKQLVPSEMARA